jgi:2-iminobutanoate/2-iminopropanoate deaminase
VSYFEENDMRVILTSEAPQPFGHYSQAVEQNGLIYVSGQLPALANGTHDATASFDVQAARALSSLDAILKEAGIRPGPHPLGLWAYQTVADVG